MVSVPTNVQNSRSIADSTIRPAEYECYLDRGKCFIDPEVIHSHLETQRKPESQKIRDIVDKSMELQRLEPTEVAALLQCDEPDLRIEMQSAAHRLKEKVYGRRIVLFAPLYASSLCHNDCLYCAFRRSNPNVTRRRLSHEEIQQEVRALIGAGHKRLVMVYGEHPSSGVHYIKETIEAAYSVKVDQGEIRRVNINAAPMSIGDLKSLGEVGIGTFQVFQETYHRPTYERLHDRRTTKGNFLWRLYALHRAQEAGIDDVAIGALFGLYDYRFEVMGLVYHCIDLEERFGNVGPHTISFPRLEPASDTPFSTNAPHRVTDEQFAHLVTVLRLSVPYTGLILTAREPADVRRKVLPLGCTQIDAGSNITIGGYASGQQQADKTQFHLSDTRTLDDTIAELAEAGTITSFCTAGYRCGRTGERFMSLARTGKVQRYCMPNAILTFLEYLQDYAAPQTRRVGTRLVRSEIQSIGDDHLRARVQQLAGRIRNGERDLYI